MNVMLRPRHHFIQCQHPLCGWRERELKFERPNVLKRAVVSIVLMVSCVAVSFVISHVDPDPGAAGAIILSTLPIMLCSLVLSFGVALVVTTSARFASLDSTNGIRHLVRCQRWCDVSTFLTNVTFLVMLPAIIYFIYESNLVMLFIHPTCFFLWLSQKGNIKGHLERAAEKFMIQQEAQGQGAAAGGGVGESGGLDTAGVQQVHGPPQPQPQPQVQVEIFVNPMPMSTSGCIEESAARSSRTQGIGGRSHPNTHTHGRLSGPTSTSTSTQVPTHGRSGPSHTRQGQGSSRSRPRPSEFQFPSRGSGSQSQSQHHQQEAVPSPTPSTAPPPSYAEVVGEERGSGSGSLHPYPGAPGGAELPPSYSQTQLGPGP